MFYHLGILKEISIFLTFCSPSLLASLFSSPSLQSASSLNIQILKLPRPCSTIGTEVCRLLVLASEREHHWGLDEVSAVDICQRSSPCHKIIIGELRPLSLFSLSVTARSILFASWTFWRASSSLASNFK